jgi:hypothetical protein
MNQPASSLTVPALADAVRTARRRWVAPLLERRTTLDLDHAPWPAPGERYEAVVAFDDVASDALERLAAHLLPDGVLVVAVRDEGMARSLEQRFAHVRFGVQRDDVASVVLPERDHRGQLLAVASDQDLPELGGVALPAGSYEPERWFELLDRQWRELGRQEVELRELTERRAEVQALRDQIERIAGDRRADTDHLLGVEARLREEQAQLLRELEHWRGRAEAVERSTSWRVTRPLRSLRAALRR